MKDILIKPILRIIAFHSWLYILAQEGPTHKTGFKAPGAPAAPNLPRLHHPPKRDRWSPDGEVSGQRGPGGEWWRWSQVAKAVQVVSGMVFKSQPPLRAECWSPGVFDSPPLADEGPACSAMPLGPAARGITMSGGGKLYRC